VRFPGANIEHINKQFALTLPSWKTKVEQMVSPDMAVLLDFNCLSENIPSTLQFTLSKLIVGDYLLMHRAPKKIFSNNA
jgi:hypothetical protein